jgi:hypothetical protein
MPAGNVILEITMSGGALVGSNMTVYLVPPGTSYQDAPSKGKQCVSPIILDKAGTRMSCRYPSWVGAKFDLMVTYKSGMVSQVAVGAGWIEYAAPIVTGVVPALVDTVEPGIATTITVSGSNFGLNSDDVTGVFAGPSFEAPLPCAPLIVLNDKTIETVKNTDHLNRFLKVGKKLDLTYLGAFTSNNNENGLLRVKQKITMYKLINKPSVNLQLVFDKNVTVQKGLNRVKISPNISNGVYWLQTEMNGQIKVTKVMKQSVSNK